MFEKIEEYAEDYFVNGFMLASDENSKQSFLAFGQFDLGINKNYLAHYSIDIDDKHFYVLTDSFAVEQLLNDPKHCQIKETYELTDLTETRKKNFIFMTTRQNRFIKICFIQSFQNAKNILTLICNKKHTARVCFFMLLLFRRHIAYSRVL